MLFMSIPPQTLSATVPLREGCLVPDRRRRSPGVRPANNPERLRYSTLARRPVGRGPDEVRSGRNHRTATVSPQDNPQCDPGARVDGQSNVVPRVREDCDGGEGRRRTDPERRRGRAQRGCPPDTEAEQHSTDDEEEEAQ